MVTYWPKKKKSYRYTSARSIQAAIRGFLGRIRAARRRDDREIENFIARGREAAARATNERADYPRYSPAGPPAAGGGEGRLYPRVPGRRGPPPGHPNMRLRMPRRSDAAAFPANHHSGSLVSNPRRGWGSRLSATSMDDFLRRHGGPYNEQTGERLRRDAQGRGVTFYDFLGNYQGGSN